MKNLILFIFIFVSLFVKGQTNKVIYPNDFYCGLDFFKGMNWFEPDEAFINNYGQEPNPGITHNKLLIKDFKKMFSIDENVKSIYRENYQLKTDNKIEVAGILVFQMEDKASVKHSLSKMLSIEGWRYFSINNYLIILMVNLHPDGKSIINDVVLHLKSKLRLKEYFPKHMDPDLPIPPPLAK